MGVLHAAVDLATDDESDDGGDDGVSDSSDDNDNDDSVVHDGDSSDDTDAEQLHLSRDPQHPLPRLQHLHTHPPAQYAHYSNERQKVIVQPNRTYQQASLQQPRQCHPQQHVSPAHLPQQKASAPAVPLPLTASRKTHLRSPPQPSTFAHLSSKAQQRSSPTPTASTPPVTQRRLATALEEVRALHNAPAKSEVVGIGGSQNATSTQLQHTHRLGSANSSRSSNGVDFAKNSARPSPQQQQQQQQQLRLKPRKVDLSRDLNATIASREASNELGSRSASSEISACNSSLNLSKMDSLRHKRDAPVRGAVLSRPTAAVEDVKSSGEKLLSSGTPPTTKAALISTSTALSSSLQSAVTVGRSSGGSAKDDDDPRRGVVFDERVRIVSYSEDRREQIRLNELYSLQSPSKVV